MANNPKRVMALRQELDQIPLKHRVTGIDYLVAFAQSIVVVWPDLDKQPSMQDFHKRSMAALGEQNVLQIELDKEVTGGLQ